MEALTGTNGKGVFLMETHSIRMWVFTENIALN